MSENAHEKVNYYPLIASFLLGLALWFAPIPAGLTPHGWRMLVVFINTIFLVVLKPLPMGAITLLSVVILLVTNTLSVGEVLSGFGSDVVWLVVLALFIAKGFSSTGLGKRLALTFTMIFGKKTLGLGYGIMATDLLLAPAIPSVTGRVAGIVYPVIEGICESYDSWPHSKSSKKIGEFLTLIAFHGTVITSAMFLTAMAANPLLQQFSLSQGLEVSWGSWALAAIVPGFISLAVVPLVIYAMCPPKIKETPDAPRHAKKKLKDMGPPSRAEWIMSGVVVLLVVLWIFGNVLHVKAITAALVGVSILLATGVLNWGSVLKNETVWDTYIWFAILLMMASFLDQHGVVRWFSDIVATSFHGYDWRFAFPILTLLYFYSHYFFASSTVHVASLFTPFLVISLAMGTPPLLAMFVLIFASSLFGGLTHYSLSPAPLLFGAGYVPIRTWWLVGFVVSVVNIVIWFGIGPLWWKLLGYW